MNKLSAIRFAFILELCASVDSTATATVSLLETITILAAAAIASSCVPRLKLLENKSSTSSQNSSQGVKDAHQQGAAIALKISLHYVAIALPWACGRLAHQLRYSALQ